jgi:hypothetical protein
MIRTTRETFGVTETILERGDSWFYLQNERAAAF